jgi:hypothetical protein
VRIGAPPSTQLQTNRCNQKRGYTRASSTLTCCPIRRCRSKRRNERQLSTCAVTRRRVSSGCKPHPAIRSSRKQPEQAIRALALYDHDRGRPSSASDRGQDLCFGMRGGKAVMLPTPPRQASRKPRKRDIPIGEAGDVSIGDLQKFGAYGAFWNIHTIAEWSVVGSSTGN